MLVKHRAHSGDDLLVVDAARASFNKESEWGWEACDVDSDLMCQVLQDKDKKLLDFLAREKHLLPFRHPQITLRCKAPIFVARQLGKHQVGMSWSEESRRYITTDPEFFYPDVLRKKADNVKQGSLDEPADTTMDLQFYTSAALAVYNTMLEQGVAPEHARMVLPQNMMVTWVWTGSLLGYFQMYQLRTGNTAQKESRDFVELVKSEVSKLYPESWAALERHM